MAPIRGVILDSDQIPEGISKKFIRYPGESQEKYTLRVTHGHFQSQKIYQIGDLSSIRVNKDTTKYSIVKYISLNCLFIMPKCHLFSMR